MLDGEGARLAPSREDEHQVRAGNVVARPPARASPTPSAPASAGSRYLAYGTREPNDIAYYPRSGKVYFRGIGLMTRLEQLDYWDGEP